MVISLKIPNKEIFDDFKAHSEDIRMFFETVFKEALDRAMKSENPSRENNAYQ